MPRTENTNDWVEVLEQAMDGKLSSVWTALPALVVSFDASKRTCVAQATIQMQFCDEKKVTRWVTLPVISDAPVQFPGGGGFVMTFPLKAGDEGILVFAARCIDHWWERGQVQQQAEVRMHDLSDAFFIPTVRSVPNVEAGISTTDVQLRNAAGSSHVAIKANGDVDVVTPGTCVATAATVNVVGSATVNLQAPNIVLTGNVTVHGTLVTDGTGAVTLSGVLNINGVPFLSHHHGGVAAGGANTSGVTP